MFRRDVVYSGSGGSKYPFEEMMPGDSFHIPTNVERNRVVTAFCAWRRRTGNNHLAGTSRKVGDGDPDGPGYRFWMDRKAR